ncbi:MAG: squalene synthase HpnC [Burkholderiaceae bacterium]
MTVNHYENFPVASLLLPRRLREPVRHIYNFARSADDIADEGDATAPERLLQLDAYQTALLQIQAGGLMLSDNDPRQAIFKPLARTITQFSLPLAPFFDLLSAFRQDVTTQRYPDDAALFDYCSRSANPVGRLMLSLYNADTSEQNLTQADCICTGLQLTNFWQDIAIDWKKSRVYLPQEKLEQYDIDEQNMAHVQTSEAWRALMHAQVRQAREQLMMGLPLGRRLPGRIGLELRLVVHGGLRILERIELLHYNVFRNRPVLQIQDWVLLLLRALR